MEPPRPAHRAQGQTSRLSRARTSSRQTPKIEIAPARVVILLVLPIRRRIRALRADKPSATQRDSDDHLTGLEDHRTDPHPRQVQQARECGTARISDDLQVRTPQSREPTV